MGPAKTQQPYEVVLSFATNPLEAQQRKIRRSRHGCFNCRKRKKKCDERRPTCSSCLDKCIKCVWPQGNEKVPEDYKIPPVDRSMVEQKRQLPADAPSISAPPRPTSPLHFSDDVSPGTAICSSQQPPVLQFEKIPIIPLDASSAVQDIIVETQQVRATSTTQSFTSMTSVEGSIGPYEGREQPLLEPVSFLGQMIYCDKMLLPTQRDKFMSAAINGFITSLGPQYTHPLLTTNATFAPLVQINPIIQRIAEACGSSFLSWSNPDLTELSSQKYAGAMDLLFDYVNKHTLTTQDELWLSAAFQLLCLGAKVTWGCDNIISVKSLKMSYSFIKKKMGRRGRKISDGTVERYQEMPRAMERNSLTDQFVDGMISNDSLKMEIENSLIEYTDDESTSLFEKQFERMFVESFIYNFSIAILVTPESEGLPNPFEVFRDTRRYLKTPLFSCDVAWMNNPVLGCSFDSYELVAKASYLIRHYQEPWVPDCAVKLLEAADYYPLPMLPQEVRHDPLKYQSLKDSILVSEIVMKAGKVVLQKVINPALKEDEPAVQREVRSVAFKLRQMSPVAMVRVISSWALFVIGLACVEEEHRAEIVNSCLTNGELVHGRYVYTIMDALDVSWGRGSKLGTHSSSRGLDVLLDHALLSKVFI